MFYKFCTLISESRKSSKGKKDLDAENGKENKGKIFGGEYQENECILSNKFSVMAIGGNVDYQPAAKKYKEEKKKIKTFNNFAKIFSRQTSRSTKIDKAAANLKQILSSQEFTKARDDYYNQEDLTSENKSCGNRSQLYFGATTAAINKKQKKNIESQLKGLESGKKVIKILKRDNLINDSQTFKQKSTSENKVFDGSCAEKIPKGACLTNVDSEVEFEDLESLVKLLPQGLNFTEEVLKNILLAYGTSSSSSLGFLNLLVFGGSVGDISGAMGQNSGFFDEMASYSGGLVEGSQSHENLIGIVPKDRMSVWSYWWGFEISIPQPSMKNLESKKSISATVLAILIGLASSSGIIEILPVLKYLSNYLDLEWKAVQSQNKGNGVVIAATWVLPMILIPRPWDFDNQQN